MRDVARHAGVSIKTVSRVVNEECEISVDTRQRVKSAIDLLGYRPNLVARSLVTRRTGIIGLIIPDITNPFFAGVTCGVQTVAREFGLNVMICSAAESGELESQALRAMVAQSVDGIVLYSAFASSLTTPVILETLAGHTPVVAINVQADLPGLTRVLTDNYDGGVQAVEYLISRGHTCLGMLAPDVRSEPTPRRVHAYRDVMAKHGLTVNPGWVTTSRASIDSGYSCATKLLTTHPELTALYCYNDLLAIGALRACQDLGKQVPGDVAIIGFDDIEMARAVSPALTTIRIDSTALGERAMRLLLNLRADPAHAPTCEFQNVTLIQRQSA